MNELKRSGVVDGKIRAVTNAQYGRLLQLIIEQAHDAALAVFVERGRGAHLGFPARRKACWQLLAPPLKDHA